MTRRIRKGSQLGGFGKQAIRPGEERLVWDAGGEGGGQLSGGLDKPIRALMRRTGHVHAEKRGWINGLVSEIVRDVRAVWKGRTWGKWIGSGSERS
jgi:hypothetical protein